MTINLQLFFGSNTLDLYLLGKRQAKPGKKVSKQASERASERKERPSQKQRFALLSPLLMASCRQAKKHRPRDFSIQPARANLATHGPED